MSEQLPQDETPSRPPRITADEARAVIALWSRRRHEHEQAAQSPSLQDLAEGLDLSVEEVSGLLQEVRDRRQAEHQESLARQERAREQHRRSADAQLRAEVGRQWLRCQEALVQATGRRGAARRAKPRRRPPAGAAQETEPLFQIVITVALLWLSSFLLLLWMLNPQR